MAYKDLANAKEAKQDEFYTQMVDIELELKNYKDFFNGKIVLCNCDDPYESNFFKYFAINFNYLGLKRLIATCYDGSPFAGEQLSLFDYLDGYQKEKFEKTAHKIVINEVLDYNHDGAIDLSDVEYLLKNDKNIMVKLKGNGDFRSEECVELLKEADVVVTNPPFSLFREYIALLEKYDKKFLIIGNIGALAYKEVFPLIKDNKVWLGQSIHSGDREFRIPKSYKVRSKSYRVDEKGNRFVRVVGIRWFTNINYKERHEQLTLYKHYSPEEYPTYDNYNAINVTSTQDIPYDYDGIMGVPVTFMDKYCPDQFEIIGMGTGDNAKELGVTKNYRGRTDLAITVNGKSSCPYQRILIRRKNNEN
ncbi:MAG: adenine-specific methyltransferase EcoRI family protein [Clostridia bacterium]|nr:adenine-specific methyltransferase EcoRI family protein [Clostridia bacterium]